MKLITCTFPKKEKLKSKSLIETLFKEGKSIKYFPIKLVYLPIEFEDTLIKIGFSVPKKNIHKAIDRNRIKRLMREVYRLNKENLMLHFNFPVAIMLIYLHNEKINFNEMQEAFLKLVESKNKD